MIFVFIGDGGGPAPPAPVTWNASDKAPSIALSSGDLVATKASANDVYAGVRATLARDVEDPDGFYFEVAVTSASSSNYISIGVANSAQVLNNYTGSGTDGWGYYQETGAKLHAGAGTAYGASYTTGDVIGVFVKAGDIEFFKNGVSQGVAFSGVTGMVYPTVALYRAIAPAHAVTGRFLASSFGYSIPSGGAAWDPN